MEIASKHNLLVIEDTAQSINTIITLRNGQKKVVGTFGHFSAFSFHQTKNITCGEGGLLVVNDTSFIDRAHIVLRNGTNRNLFKEGEISKYDWVGVGSSFLLSEINAAYLLAQLNCFELVDKKRKELWELYFQTLGANKKIIIPSLLKYYSNNYHIFHLVCSNIEERARLIKYLEERNIQAVFHYQSLHESPYFEKKFSNCLLRLPFYFDLTEGRGIICFKLYFNFLF